MSGHITVRNSCPFPVTFWAIAGPAIELKPGERRSAEACLIWFSTRVKGPGKTFNQGFFESLQDEYREQLSNDLSDVFEWQDGGTGAAAGSMLGLAIGQLEKVFKIQHTQEGNTIYFGNLKEGVYGQADLAIWATLDPACKDPRVAPIWSLHLDYENNQKTIVPSASLAAAQVVDLYQPPDLSAYSEKMFVRLVYNGNFLFLAGKDGMLSRGAVPYDPLNRSEYWNPIPQTTDKRGYDFKLLNHATQQYLRFDGQKRSVGISTSVADHPDQHWGAAARYGLVFITNKGHSANGMLGASMSSSSGVAIVRDPTGVQPSTFMWRVETFADELREFREEQMFAIMSCKTGMYMATDISSAQPAMKSESTTSNVVRCRVKKEANDEFTLWFCNRNAYLSFNRTKKIVEFVPEGMGDESERRWKISLPSDRCGFFLLNKTQPPESHLYWDGKTFGMASKGFTDERWILVMTYLPDFGDIPPGLQL